MSNRTAVETPARKSPFEIARAWYDEEQIVYSVQHAGMYGNPTIPADVTSAEFGKWLTNEYQLAMAKGIQLGRDGSED